ncbi:hypothetical protein BT67DRAFT_453426 [Trichocladium antarcticum]|uniref:G-patch domain-containing protein n=1 Tax=Trichocladium antarcticum TaxID=1450529 RepID=A0AAN6ZHS5_9PEZI|nr:hypothetical protein BT67DRAFT_453426 [Trichocladium antarcticum]
MAAPPPQPPRGGMSLYASLLESGDNSASISRDPVLFNEAKDAAQAKKAIDPAFRFQPIRRPQTKQPNKPKPAFPKAPPAIPASAPAASTGAAAPPQSRSTLADWAAADDDNYLYTASADKRQRGGRRKKKKADDRPRETDWNEIYDPTRPTNVEEYLRSEEHIQEVRDWKAVLYAHRRQRRPSYGSDAQSDDEEDRGVLLGNQFAPPSSLIFAPPPLSPPRAAAPIPVDTTGDDAYARRLALAGTAPPPADSTTISRAPVRYFPPPRQPSPTMDLDATPPQPAPPSEPQQDDGGEEGEEASRSSRPGQKGFAQRLMAKYGWTKGAGLGAAEAGITAALRVQVEKRKRRPDAEGGGFVDRGGRGRVILPGAGKPKGNGKGGGEGELGKMSVVVVLRNMLDNMPDLAREVEAGLGQEIGEECGERYGRVERLFIDLAGRRVFIKFTEGVSALRAVNALEGRVFNGNAIVARFYDADKFEEGVYDG